jgi:IclR-like helix-turn-helix domain-containing protein
VATRLRGRYEWEEQYVGELLERIHREIRERLAASRAAVLEHERLEAALRALGDTGSNASRAVSGRGGSGRAPARAPGGAAKRTSAGTGKRASAAPGTARRGASAAPAGARGASSAKGRRRSTRRTGGATPRRKRAPRGANREAVLRVIGERPGVSARELGSVSGVTGGTLYALLRTLTEHGEIEKRKLPAGQTGYTLAATATTAAARQPTRSADHSQPTSATTSTPAASVHQTETARRPPTP